MCSPSPDQGLNGQQGNSYTSQRSGVGPCSVSPKPEAYRSSNAWLSKASLAAKWLYPPTLGDVKNSEEKILANLL